jgi:hypothetical protein
MQCSAILAFIYTLMPAFKLISKAYACSFEGLFPSYTQVLLFNILKVTDQVIGGFIISM